MKTCRNLTSMRTRMPTPDYKQMVKDIVIAVGVDWTAGPSWEDTREEILIEIRRQRFGCQPQSDPYKFGYSEGYRDGQTFGRMDGRKTGWAQRSGDLINNLTSWAKEHERFAARATNAEVARANRMYARFYRDIVQRLKSGEL